MTDNISQEIQALELDATEAYILLYQLEWVPGDTTTGTSSIYLNFHSYDTDETITFDGEEYEPMPIAIEGIERHSDGASARPRLTIPNVETLFRNNNPLRTQLAAAPLNVSDFVLDDLLGKRLVYRRTLKKYVKLSSESATPSNSFQFPRSEYVIDRISGKTSISVELELASPFELTGVKVPNRVVVGKYCPWSYKGWRLDKTDVKSACHWDSKMRDHNGDRPFQFFTIDDEPLIFRECLPTNLGDLGYSSSTTYNINDIVYFAPLLYQATSETVGNTPAEKSGHWRIVRTYELWTNSLPVTIFDGDARRATYAFKNGEVYKAVVPQNPSGATGQTNDPETNPASWVRGDVCGKLIASCKARYQSDIRTAISQTGVTAIKTDANGVKHAVPSAIFNNQISLPFGGFPGTKGFR